MWQDQYYYSTCDQISTIANNANALLQILDQDLIYNQVKTKINTKTISRRSRPGSVCEYQDHVH